jgi:hypothetical protein
MVLSEHQYRQEGLSKKNEVPSHGLSVSIFFARLVLPHPHGGKIMTKFSIGNKEFVNFLSNFGKDLVDIVIKVTHSNISASVAKSTHYIYRKVDCEPEETGKVYITDIPKVKNYLSTVKSDNITVSQSGKTGTLHIRGKDTSLQLPTSSFIESQKKVGIIEKAIADSKESMWRSWFHTPLTHHAKVEANALRPVSGFGKVLGDKINCKTEFDSDGQEFIIRGGKKETGKMFVRASLTDVESNSTFARSAFDKWLPQLLSHLPSGQIDMHTGDETVLILEQPSTGFLMIVIDQEYEED